MSFGIRGSFGNIDTHPSGVCSQLPMETVTVTVRNADTTAKSKGQGVHLEYTGGEWTADIIAGGDITGATELGGLFGICAEAIAASGTGKVHLKGRVEALGGDTSAAGLPLKFEHTTGEVVAAAEDDESLKVGINGEEALTDGVLHPIYFDGFILTRETDTAAG